MKYIKLFSDSESKYDGDVIVTAELSGKLYEEKSASITDGGGISGSDKDYYVVDSKENNKVKILKNGNKINIDDKNKLPADLESVILLPKKNEKDNNRIFVLGSRGEYAELEDKENTLVVTGEGKIDLHNDILKLEKINIESCFYNPKRNMIGYVQREGSLSRHNYYIQMDYTKPFFYSVEKNVRPEATKGVRVAEVKYINGYDVSLYAIENNDDDHKSRGSNKLIVSKNKSVELESKWSQNALHKYEAFDTNIDDVYLIMELYNKIQGKNKVNKENYGNIFKNITSKFYLTNLGLKIYNLLFYLMIFILFFFIYENKDYLIEYIKQILIF